MTDPIAQTTLSQARSQAEPTTPNCTFHGFMKLPAEIRLQIYEELVVPKFDLYRARCSSCWLRVKFHPYDKKSYRSLAYTHILKTSKQNYSETLPIIYSKTTVHVKCRKCERSQCTGLWACQVEPHDLGSDGIEHYHRHIKNIAITYEAGLVKYHTVTTEFPNHWPTIEREILKGYQNTEHISLRFRLGYTYVTFDLVRRSCDPPTERVHDYESVLAQHNAYRLKYMDYRGTTALEALVETCDAIVLSHAQEGLARTAFAVQSIRWQLSPEDPESQ